jgi:hypothetical protein
MGQNLRAANGSRVARSHSAETPHFLRAQKLDQPAVYFSATARPGDSLRSIVGCFSLCVSNSLFLRFPTVSSNVSGL